jgi:hypothetical protein
MTVLSYLGPAALVLALSWAVVKLTRMPLGTPAIAAVTAVVVFSLIAITPLCGFMFNYGCDWPWSGLYHHCNFFDALSKLKCPWCNSVAAGLLSMLAVFGASIFAAYRASSITASANARFTIGVLAGALTFHLVSLLLSPLDIRCRSRLKRERASQHCAGRRSQFVALIQAMIFQISSSVLKISPKCGIGPTTFSEPLRTKPCF